MVLRRGDLVLVVASGDFGKPRPAVIVQSDTLNETQGTFVVCPLTSDLIDAALVRVSMIPNVTNGLRVPSQIMVDKITALRSDRIRERIGSIDDPTLRELDRILAVVLGLAD